MPWLVEHVPSGCSSVNPRPHQSETGCSIDIKWHTYHTNMQRRTAQFAPPQGNSSPASGERHPQKLCATLTLKRVWKVRCTKNEFWPRLRTGLVRPQVCKASASSTGWLDGFLPAIGHFPTSEDGNEGIRPHACSSIVGCHQHSAYQQSVQELQDWCALAYIRRKHKWQRPTVSLPFYTIERLHGNAHPCWLQMALSLDLRDQINTIKRRRKVSG